MGYTKRQLVRDALTQIGLGSTMFEIEPETLADAVRVLDAMMAEWNAQGLRLGYLIPTYPNGGDVDGQSNIPDRAWRPVITNLALDLCPMFGKTPPPRLMTAAKSGRDTLMVYALDMKPVSYAGLPAGAGNKSWRRPGATFIPTAIPDIETGPDGFLEL